MIRFLLLGTSVPEDGYAILWGIDLETYSIVKMQASFGVAYKMQVYCEYTVECEMIGNGTPTFLIEKIVKEKNYGREQVLDVLDFIASYSRTFISEVETWMLAKVDECKKINVYHQYAELQISIAGIREQYFTIENLDWRWEKYWHDQASYADCSLITNYLNNSNVYMLIEHKKNSLGKAHKCMVMLVV